MKEIKITTQAQYDALPEKFDEFTQINIHCDLIIKKVPGSSSVVARGSSRVEAWESSRVEAWESSSVVAWGSSRVRALENATVRLLSAAVLLVAFHWATIICQDCKPKIEKHGCHVTIVRTKTMKHTKKTFCDICQPKDGKVTLYKSVRPDTRCDFATGKIKYEGTVDCPDWDPNPKRQCGGGLHLSPTPGAARSYNDGLILECRVAIKDFVVYADDISKVRCKRVTVIGEAKV